jgi:hypothetical protein
MCRISLSDSHVRVGRAIPDQIQVAGNIDFSARAANVPPGGQITTLHASIVCSPPLNWSRAPPCIMGGARLVGSKLVLLLETMVRTSGTGQDGQTGCVFALHITA